MFIGYHPAWMLLGCGKCYTYSIPIAVIKYRSKCIWWPTYWS